MSWDILFEVPQNQYTYSDIFFRNFVRHLFDTFPIPFFGPDTFSIPFQYLFDTFSTPIFLPGTFSDTYQNTFCLDTLADTYFQTRHLLAPWGHPFFRSAFSGGGAWRRFRGAMGRMGRGRGKDGQGNRGQGERAAGAGRSRRRAGGKRDGKAEGGRDSNGHIMGQNA